MLCVYDGLRKLRFGELMKLYREAVAENGAEAYPELSAGEQILRAEQDFYDYLRQGFFTQADDCYCIWQENGAYVCALRLQRFRDGLLLEALETRPEYRRQGYAEKLIRAVQERVEQQRIYSHIHHKNLPSRAVHEKCGFRMVCDIARYADGSVNDRCGTYLYCKNAAL